MIGQAELQGHWRRDWIRAPGVEDHTTRVHWLQAGALFADIRVPLVRPDLTGRSCLADLSQPELATLMQAEGFAGDIAVSENRCTWRRAINWHGVPEADDVGQMSFDGGALIEDGVLAEYRELWQQQGGASRGHRVSAGTQSGVLIESDAVFLIGLGPVPKGTSKPLLQALHAGTATLEALQEHFASTYCLGRWEGEQGIASLSTNPFCEARPVLTRGSTWSWAAPGFQGAAIPQPLVFP